MELAELVPLARDYLASEEAWRKHQRDDPGWEEKWRAEDAANGWDAKYEAFGKALKARDPDWDADDDTGAARLILEFAGSEPETRPIPHKWLPQHCGLCGDRWPRREGQADASVSQCPNCGGLPCRADTTDTVAPDPPCMGSARWNVARA